MEDGKYVLYHIDINGNHTQASGSFEINEGYLLGPEGLVAEVVDEGYVDEEKKWHLKRLLNGYYNIKKVQ